MCDRRSILACALIVLCVVGISTPAWSGERNHESGLFLRLSGGLGFAATEITSRGEGGEIHGPGVDLNLAIGGIVSPNLALHATLFGWSLSNPDVSLFELSGELDGTFGLSAIGAGVTYYIMPGNVYLSGSIGAGRHYLDIPGDDAKSEMGVAFNLIVGKEWWVGSTLGLGVAGTLGFHSIPEKGIDNNWSGSNIGVLFSATLN